MSIEERSTEVVVAGQSPTIVSRSHPKYWHTVLRSPLWFCLLVALLIRVWLVYHTHGVVDGDEALVGFQAQHILRGEHPIYYYGQPYMGSLEAYLVALLFAIAGSSVWILRAEPILLSLLIVWLTWKLAGALGQAAQLSPFAQQVFKTIAALCAAIPPLYDTVLELRTNGGYRETFVLMLLMLLSVFHLTRRWHAGASKKELALHWVGIGFIAGLGFWIFPLISTVILVAAIWIALFCLTELGHLSRQTLPDVRRSPLSVLTKLLLAVAAIPTFIVGLAPAIRWGFTHQWINFTFMLQLGSVQSINIGLRPRYHSRLALILDLAYLYKTYVAPRVISGALPKESSILISFHSFTLALGLFCIFATLLLVALSFLWHNPELLRIRRLAALPSLFAIMTAFTFCSSTSSSAGLISFQNDLAGRYATPLMLALPFFFATIFTLVSVYIYKLSKKRFLNSGEAGNSLQRVAAAVVSSRLRVSMVAQGLVFAFLLAYLSTQVATYVLTDPDYTFLSPSCPFAPANDAPIIAYFFF